MLNFRNQFSSAFKYTLAGVFFGFLFPVIATAVAANLSYGFVSWGTLVQTQRLDPLIWIINTAPFFLGLFAYFAGRNQDLLQQQVENQERIIGEQTAALREALDDAHLAIQAKSQFMANMSHELRTPLNAIIGYSEMIEDDLSEDPALIDGISAREELLSDIQKVKGAGHHLLHLVSTILDFSKIEAEKSPLRAEPFHLHQAIQTVVDLLMPKIKENHIDFSCNSCAGLPVEVVGDRVKFQQILINILSNAIKFTEAGQIELSLSAKSASAQPGTVVISGCVKDSGIGIAPEDLDVVMQPFHQADNSIARRYEGTGLGLSISKQLCELMGGKFKIESKGLGEGAEVSFEVRFMVDEAV